MKMYIISYLGSESQRCRRKEIHTDQIDWALEQGLDVYVVNQQYRDGDWDRRVTYIGDNELRSPGGARNVAFRHFYASDDDWAIFADNDSTTGDTVEGQNWLQVFRDMSLDQLRQVECFQPVNGGRTPFNKRIQDDLKTYQENLWFDRTPILKGSFFVLKNIRKHHNLELFQEEDWICDPSTGLKIGMEDTRFGLELIRAGLSNYMLWNAKLRERGDSTWLRKEDRGARAAAVHAGKQYIAEYFGLEWVPERNRVRNYNPIYSCSTRPRTLLVPVRAESDLFSWSPAPPGGGD